MTNKTQHYLINGHDWAVSRHGQGKPLIALHGFSETSATWDKLQIQGYQILALDLLGHGASSKPHELKAYQFEALLDQLHQLFKALLGGKSFSLLGYSLGGRLALAYAIKFPEAPIDKLILESAGTGLSSPEQRLERQKADEQLAQAILDKGSEWFADYWANLPLFDSQKELDFDLQKNIWLRRSSNTAQALALTLRASGLGQMPYLAPNIEELNLPILYLYGQKDKKFAQIAKRDFQPLANTSLIQIPNCGHNTHLENPDLFNRVIEAYLRQSGDLYDIIKQS